MPHLDSNDKTAVTAAPVLSVIAERWSPRSYDANHKISAVEVTSLLEAARWAPSANNLQPWRFSVIKREDALFADLVQHGLKGWNQAWAPNASAIIIVSAVMADNDGKQNPFAPFDAGLATQNLLLEATHLGLSGHVLGGIEAEWLDEALGLDDNIKPLVGITVGKRALPEELEGALHDREVAPRSRLSLDEIVLHGKP
ncbi:MAG: nitroreductase family protein [Actinomycetales bacterium]|nr:nitroreductase family protein [Actinomycetales bacterium]